MGGVSKLVLRQRRQLPGPNCLRLRGAVDDPAGTIRAEPAGRGSRPSQRRRSAELETIKRPFVHRALTPLLLTILLSAIAAGAQRSPGSSKVSFAKAIRIFTPQNYPSSLAAGDLNRDGFADLVVVSATDGGAYPYIAYALGKGNGHFGAWQYGPSTYAPPFVLLADATGNGKLDALTDDAIANDMVLAFGNGKGDFPTSEQLGFTGQNDLFLCSDLKVPSKNADCATHSVDITCWIAKEAFSMQELPEGPGKCPADVQF